MVNEDWRRLESFVIPLIAGRSTTQEGAGTGSAAQQCQLVLIIHHHGKAGKSLNKPVHRLRLLQQCV